MWVIKKSGRWVGARSKGKGCECDIDRNMFFHSDLLNLCLKQKNNITELLSDTIMFFDDKNLQ